MDKNYTVGIDLGATNIKAGLILGNKFLAKNVVPTTDFPSPGELINALREQVNQLLKQTGVSKNNLAGIGIGVPGPVDSIRGTTHYFPNIKGWHNVALKKILQDKTGLPVFIDNDANLMTLAEGRLGAAKGKKNVIGITLGTGVGGGILVNGSLYRGASLSAGELGHIPINEEGPSCACGGKACLERYAGNRYILEKARKAFGQNITLEELSSLANKGNNRAVKIWKDIAGHLAVCLTGVVNFFNPDTIVIGGGVAAAGRILFKAIRQGIKKRAMPTQARAVKVVKARLGNDAGMLGAALLVKENRFKVSPQAIFRGSRLISFWLGIFIFLNICSLSFCAVELEQTEEEKKNEPQSSMLTDMESESTIIVNGDKIDYAQDKNIVTITGNVEITKGNSVMTCDRAIVNTLTNDAHAEGNVILKDLKGIIKARSCDYNFKTQAGLAFDANVAYKPYYGKGKIVKKISENEIEIKNGYFTTCDKDHPHYRIQSRIMQIFPEDKVTCRAMTFRVANTPIIYLPKFTQNLKDDRMHVQVTAGKSKDWGMFLLTAWRYDLLNNSGGRVHMDYREKKELAWGIDNYYDTKTVGKGYFKTYYMNERYLGRKRLYKYPRTLKETTDTQRYRIQWRHKWEVDKKSYFQMEYNKVTDTKFIKDYFFREYEKNNENTSTSSYLQYNRIVADTDTLSFLARKRTSRIFSETEILPEIKYDHPSIQILESPFYLSHTVTYDSFNKVTATTQGNAGSWGEDEASQRIDTYSRLSLPFKLSFLDLNPFMGTRETYFQRIAGRNAGQFREVWDSGVDATTRFYRVFDVQSDAFGIEINKLRHIINPTVGWAYTYKPTVSSSKLLQFDGIDSIGEANQINMSLENKLQTKRGDKKNKDTSKEQVLKTVDFARFITSTDYKFAIEGRKRQWNHNVIFDLETIPYEWLRFESDANLDRKKGYFTTANFDLKASGKGMSWGGGYRYERKSSAQMTGEIILDLIKGWSFTVYQRLQFKGNSLVKEQTYKLSKELHCWIFDVNYNVLREKGETIWFALRLKAFPEMAIDYNQNYHEPKALSQNYPEGKSSD